MKGYGPTDPLHAPRVAGVSTFLRLPHTLHLHNVDVAFVGLPFDTGANVHASARIGPRAIREASLSLRPFYNANQRVAIFESVSAIDYGDAPVVAGFTDRSQTSMAETLSHLHAENVIPIGLGGDHRVLLAELRAAATTHGELALILFDAHADSEDDEGGDRSAHTTCLRRAVSEGLIDPRRSTLLGMRGGLRRARELDDDRDLGFSVIAWEELAQLGTGAVAAAVDRAAGPSFLSFDMGFVDPAFAPGAGVLECGGPSSMQALALVRACRGLEVVGADVVEILPELDTTRVTATLAATVAWEILSLVAADWLRRSE